MRFAVLCEDARDGHAHGLLNPGVRIEKLNPAPAALNFSKLEHFNGLHIREMHTSDLAMRIKPFFEGAGYVVDEAEKLDQIAAALQVRLKLLSDAPEIAGFFFKDEVQPEPESLIGKKMTAAESLAMAKEIYQLVQTLPDFSLFTLRRLTEQQPDLSRIE